MAEKKAVPGEPEKFMTVFRPEQAVVATSEENKDKDPNQKLEDQRKAFEAFEKAQQEGDEEAVVEAKAKDLENDLRAKSVAEGVSMKQALADKKSEGAVKNELKEVARTEVKATNEVKKAAGK